VNEKFLVWYIFSLIMSFVALLDFHNLFSITYFEWTLDTMDCAFEDDGPIALVIDE